MNYFKNMEKRLNTNKFAITLGVLNEEKSILDSGISNLLPLLGSFFL